MSVTQQIISIVQTTASRESSFLKNASYSPTMGVQLCVPYTLCNFGFCAIDLEIVYASDQSGDPFQFYRLVM